MARVVWKGAITFGLVHIPITLRAAAKNNDLDFDWLDKRDMAPVGYQRINKVTGAPVESENIVKGYQYEKGEYVLMSDEDFKQANPTATQTVDILQFVDVTQIPPYYFDTPYYLEAGKRGEKGYALLRETLRRTGRAGLASVVMYRKQHLAAVLVVGDLLMLNTVRFADEVQAADDLNVPSNDLADVGVRPNELAIAEQLVSEMTGPFDPAQYKNQYREDLLKRVDAKIRGGETHLLTPPGEEPAAGGAQVIDLMEALKQSLQRTGRKPPSAGAAREAREDRAAPPPASARKTARSRKADERPTPAPNPAPARAEPKRRKTEREKAEAQAEPALDEAPRTRRKRA